jgi:threonine dehydrogenase-like Zn-dependent dehydrogenase
MFDKQIQLSMDLANGWRWVEGIMPLATDDADPFSTENFTRHHLPLDQTPHGYEIFRKKQDDANKILLQP